MLRNVGSLDRALRVAIGAAILGAGVALGQWWAVIGAVPLASGITGYSPAYGMTGMTTVRPKAQPVPVEDTRRRRRLPRQD